MASLVDIVRLCRLHMRPLQLHLLRSADPTDPDKTTLIYRSEEVTQHFRWWLDPKEFRGTLSIQLPMTSITTDASLSGWGAHWSNRTAWGTVVPTINILEMMAVKRALEAFNDHVQGTITTIFTDNTTVVAYINRQGAPVRETVPTRVGGDNSGRGLRHDPTGFPHRRQAQRDGGRLIQGAYRPQRMVSGTGDLRQNLFDLRQAHDRPVRNTQEQQTPDLLFQTIPPPGLPHGRNVPLWDHMDAYIFPLV
ncbi:putative TBC1 domain family member 2A [Apostichopus japonicus]|uniref:Putative TBC1 domain family member 2A n=1 Tax=Stichopus japonicus TaxID=307972 RepID=A0A2G8L2B6_STIJA|nr:putative TBC1 domain family member 2A [Apostichopus japonicus]